MVCGSVQTAGSVVTASLLVLREEFVLLTESDVVSVGADGVDGTASGTGSKVEGLSVLV